MSFSKKKKKKKENSASSVNVNRNNILKKVQNFNPNKAHGHDMNSISIVKISGESIIKPLQMKFKSCIKNSVFPNEWKKANVISIHKKEQRNI